MCHMRVMINPHNRHFTTKLPLGHENTCFYVFGKYRDLLLAIAVFLVLDLGVLVFFQSSRLIEEGYTPHRYDRRYAGVFAATRQGCRDALTRNRSW